MSEQTPNTSRNPHIGQDPEKTGFGRQASAEENEQYRHYIAATDRHAVRWADVVEGSTELFVEMETAREKEKSELERKNNKTRADRRKLKRITAQEEADKKTGSPYQHRERWIRRVNPGHFDTDEDRRRDPVAYNKRVCQRSMLETVIQASIYQQDSVDPPPPHRESLGERMKAALAGVALLDIDGRIRTVKHYGNREQRRELKGYLKKRSEEISLGEKPT